jgi:HEAT repeat protein
MITTALSSVGSPEAQDALCTAIRAKESDAQALVTLVPTLGSFHQPTERVVALLQELSQSSSRDIRSTALLALGATAKNLAPQLSKRSGAIISDLAFRFAGSSLLDEKASLLLALGNSGSKEAENIILSQKNNPSLELRTTAISVLADFQSDESLRALCDTLRADQNPQARSTAAQALGPRSGVDIAKDSLLHAAQDDLAESVRIASMFALTALIPRDARVREVIDTIAQNDTSETVRKQAASLLQKNQSPNN